MYFWDEKRRRPVNKCSSCQAGFSAKKGSNCLSSCLARQLEIKHQKATRKIISYIFPKQKIKIDYGLHLSVETIREKGWGWTDDIKQIITIPWWTLRSKKEFFDTIVHEAGHIFAYWKRFDLVERNILKKFALLEEKREGAFKNDDSDKFIELNREIRKRLAVRENKRAIDKYLKWEGHDYNPWYQEYRRLFKMLLSSPFAKYTYGQTEPRKHGFDKYGKGKYKPKLG